MLLADPRSQTVRAGRWVTLTAGASAVGAAVQWQVSRDGGQTFNNMAGARSTTLTFLATAGRNGLECRAVFTSPAGSATTGVATLTVVFAPAVTLQPTSVVAHAGDTVTFTAGAIANPGATVQWQVSSNGGTFTNIPGANDDSYTIAGVTAANNRQRFRAVFINSLGYAITRAAALTVVP
jgi:hypothetical protein